MESFFMWTVVFVAAGGGLVDCFPGRTLRVLRSQRSLSTSNNVTAAPNLDYQWLTHIRQAPKIVSFHDEEDYVEKYQNFDNLMHAILEVLLCPLYINLDLPDKDPQKNQTAVLFTEEDANGSTVLLTDNKTYFVALGWEGEATVTVFRFIDPLSAAEEAKIKKLLEEVKFKVKPTFEIKVDTCN